jgi:hypothetical protein
MSKLQGLPQTLFQARPFVQPGNPPGGSGTYVWVLAHDGVPGHWERPRASGEDPNRHTTANSDSVFKIAAVRCRRIPRKPKGGDSRSAASNESTGASETGGVTGDQTTTTTT